MKARCNCLLWIFCRFPLMSCESYLPLPIVRAFSSRYRLRPSVSPLSAWSASIELDRLPLPTMPSADFCAAIRVASRLPSVSNFGDTTQTSRGKFDSFPRTPAGSTALALDGYGLRDQSPARPTRDASYPVSVRQVAALLHASFRRHLAMTPLRFANPSPPSGWIGDFHPQALEHARHTTKPLRGGGYRAKFSALICICFSH